MTYKHFVSWLALLTTVPLSALAANPLAQRIIELTFNQTTVQCGKPIGPRWKFHGDPATVNSGLAFIYLGIPNTDGRIANAINLKGGDGVPVDAEAAQLTVGPFMTPGDGYRLIMTFLGNTEQSPPFSIVA